jgi:hypothetical protein
MQVVAVAHHGMLVVVVVVLEVVVLDIMVLLVQLELTD